MVNERNTENLVRQMLRDKGYYDDENIVIEEQKSASPKISKLLQGASKSGKGIGKPEFIIRFKDKPEDLIVIECKADPLKHVSEGRIDAKNYAVDGVLLYAECLKEKFNVTAIAVSGETETEKRISTFLWLKEAYTYSDIEENNLLTYSDINQIILRQQEPIDENELVKRAIQYNKDLHSYSIPEVERCTLVSSILVALQNEPFLKSYSSHTDNIALLKALYAACESVLKKNEILSDKIEIILDEYKKPKNTNALTSEFIKKRKNKEKEINTVLKDLIDSFKNNILPSVKQEQFDILGKFYRQFIRYAGSDAKTGLVLTPNHITDFFCDIVDIKGSDVVFDPCCGTGGFLVSAMNCMIKKVGKSKDKHKTIKSNQLIGIENRGDMFSHACSNMMMRGDGKSQIHFGDCLDTELHEIIKSKKPNIVFLNPPYQEGNADTQLEFIEAALGCITGQGQGVAICQMSTVVSLDKKVIEVKRRLLESHTLKAVFSMPDDLFYPIGVATCILVFEANNSHDSTKETFFGYYKDDGFIKDKKLGRIDGENKWNEKKDKWLKLYKRNDDEIRLSVRKAVAPENEWCAEAYMETDYSNLKEEDFVNTLKQFIAYQFLNNGMKVIKPSKKSTNSTAINLDIRKWEKFSYNDIFDIKKGERLTKGDREKGNTPLCTSKSVNNGIDVEISKSYYIDSKKLFKDKITIDMFHNVFYHGYEYFSDDNVHTLINKNETNIFIDMFIATVAKADKYRYAYGRQVRLSRLKEQSIKLPAKSKDEPDWQFMEDYIKSLPYSSNL